MKINQAFTILAQHSDTHVARIITENNKKLTRWQVWKIVRKLKRGVPVAKIINKKWFWGLQFYTNRHTLDPRPDTETLVSAVIADADKDTAPRILDIGTGTGCIVISLIKSINGATGVGIDKSRRALRVARKNVKQMNLGNLVQIKRGTFDKKMDTWGTFDIIVSNPPYIARGDNRVDTGARHDPQMALYADNDGYKAYEKIAQNAKFALKKGGKIYLEIGVDMGLGVQEIFARHGWEYERSENDLGGVERVLVFTLL